MPETFETLLAKLSRAGVDYLVAGGVAVCLNGFVQTTQDIDLLVDASPANIDKLLAVLATFGQGFARELSREDFALVEGAVRLNEDFTVDIFTVMRGRTFADPCDGAHADHGRNCHSVSGSRIVGRAEVPLDARQGTAWMWRRCGGSSRAK